MRAGVWILNVFAAIWGAIGVSRYGWPTMAIPVAISSVLIVWGSRMPAPLRSAEEGRRIGWLVAAWSSAEGVAIFATVALCARLGLNEHAPSHRLGAALMREAMWPSCISTTPR